MFTSKQKFWVLAGCIGALLATLAGYNLLNQILPTSDDVAIYFRYARRALNGELPYRDYLVEYPPFSLPFFIVPGFLCYILGNFSLQTYSIAFHTQCFLLTLLTLWLVSKLYLKLYPDTNWQKAAWRLGLFSFGCVAISLYLFQRYDIAASCLTFGAVYLFMQKRPIAAGFMLGLATACKLYPAILLPLFLLYFWYYHAKPEQPFSLSIFKPSVAPALKIIAGFSSGVLLVALPFYLASPSGFLKFLSYHGERGLELESIFAGLVVFASYLGIAPAITMVEAAALGLASPWVKPLASFSTLLTLGGLAVFYLWFWRKFARLRLYSASKDKESQFVKQSQFLLEASSVLLLWFILANKVLSPQYMIWLLPLAVFWRGKLKIGLFLAVLPLSVIPFPFLVDGLISLDPLPYILLLVRNSLLGIIFGLLLRDLRRSW